MLDLYDFRYLNYNNFLKYFLKIFKLKYSEKGQAKYRILKKSNKGGEENKNCQKIVKMQQNIAKCS